MRLEKFKFCNYVLYLNGPDVNHGQRFVNSKNSFQLFAPSEHCVQNCRIELNFALGRTTRLHVPCFMLNVGRTLCKMRTCEVHAADE